MNCPSCGAAIQDGKFCKYCGAKLPDDTKRMEVRIENLAEMKRADYETEESKLRQREAEAEFKRRKVKRISSLTFLIVFLLIGVFGVLDLTPFSIIEILIGLFGGGFMIVHVVKQLITGKW